MKKILSFAMAAVLLVAGCAKDVDSLNGGETVAVTFSANLPIEVSRTVGDGSQANVLNYAIYDTNGNLFADYPYENDIEVSGNKATVTLELVKGQSYNVAFWAQNEENDTYTFDRTAGTVTVNYDDQEKSNDETYDAFYVLEPITVSGPAVKDVVLKRPFAQINLGATKKDVEAAKKLDIEIDASMVTLTNVYQTLNLYSGEASNPTTATVEFGYNELPGNDLTVKDVDYAYIAANYILANGESDVTELTFAVKDGDKVVNTVNVPSVNYQRNHRTNILGRLLTSSIDFNIEIDGTPEGDIALGKEAELYLAMQTDGVYTLSEDMTLSQPFVVEEGVNFTLNLAGYKLSGESETGGGVVVNNGTLTVKGGTIVSTKVNSGAAVLNKGVMTIENATIEGARSDTATGYASYAVNSQGENSKLVVNNSSISGRGAIGATKGTKVEINGGTYHTPAVASGHAVYASNEGTEVVINGGTFSEGYEAAATNWGMYQITATNKAKVIVNGGNFEPWDCANGYDLHTAYEGVIEIYGGAFADNPSSQNGKNYVADGYKAVESNGKWVVVEANVDAVASTPAELDTALAAGGQTVVMATDVESAPEKTAPYGNKYAFALNGGVLDGNGNELSMPCNGDHYGIMTTGGTVKNITIEWGCRAIMIMYPTEDVIVDNAKIGGDGVLYTINTGESGPNPVKLIVSNSTIAGWTSYGPAVESASFTNVKFEQGTYYNNIYGRVFKPYVNTTMTECSFVAHMNLDLSALVSGHKVVLKNCTVDGQPLTIDKIVIPQTDAQYDTELITVDLPGWATGIADCVSFE